MWFGDERGYNATMLCVLRLIVSCGLVMKEDITQQWQYSKTCGSGCGLVMKEDITQLMSVSRSARTCCGLVMKEDITQRRIRIDSTSWVVVW